MIRVLPDDVVKAYAATNLIPIRCAWTTTDSRGGCAIDALAIHHGVATEDLREQLTEGYEEGFLLAWDAQDPRCDAIINWVKANTSDVLKRGFCDGLLCRSAVEKTFSSELFPVIPDKA